MKGLKMAPLHQPPSDWMWDCKEYGTSEVCSVSEIGFGYFHSAYVSTCFNATIHENHEDQQLVNSLWSETLSPEYSNWGLSLESGNSSGTQWSTSYWFHTGQFPIPMQATPRCCTANPIGTVQGSSVCNALHRESCDWIGKGGSQRAECGDSPGEICQTVKFALWLWLLIAEREREAETKVCRSEILVLEEWCEEYHSG